MKWKRRRLEGSRSSRIVVRSGGTAWRRSFAACVMVAYSGCGGRAVGTFFNSLQLQRFQALSCVRRHALPTQSYQIATPVPWSLSFHQSYLQLMPRTCVLCGSPDICTVRLRAITPQKLVLETFPCRLLPAICRRSHDVDSTSVSPLLHPGHRQDISRRIFPPPCELVRVSGGLGFIMPLICPLIPQLQLSNLDHM